MDAVLEEKPNSGKQSKSKTKKEAKNMKLRKKSILILIAAMAIMMLTSGCGQVKIGYIDGERVTKEAPQISALVEEGNQKIMEAQQQASQDVQKKK